ncbi:hypothetical protein [Dongia sp.]|uniref:hypothetical protein n=1 Tax=Dongia sp. TaxID=1977262 RepID=UPI0035B136B3
MSDFEERADQLSLEAIDSSLADGEIFRRARKKLLAPGAKLLIGPRGTGKTHLMRFTYSHAIRNSDAPLALYASFNRYLNLEPLLTTAPDAKERFHSWVLAKLLLSCFDFLNDSTAEESALSSLGEVYNQQRLSELVSLLERGSGKTAYDTYGRELTISHVIAAIDHLCKQFGRKRAILLLDDAALSLTSQYLIAFFDVFRLLKTETISPKASVYPGSTQYGPTFHASHEAEEIPLWLSIEDSEYTKIMGDIGNRRLTSNELISINDDLLEMFKYVSFGIPRAYLRLLREYLDSSAGSSQQKINKIVERHAELVGAEFDSLGIKLRQFSSLVATGRKFFDHVVSAVVSAHIKDTGHRNIIFGLQQDADRTPLVERMLKFLIEVGMLFPLQAVSHGPSRKYDRYIPHLAFLYLQGLFRQGRASSFKDVASYMQKAPAKHPIRRNMASLLRADEMHLDLPPCQKCGTARINESQRYCHECGAELVASSLFENCMKLPLEKVPGISSALIKRVHADTKIRTIGHVFASQNASADLQQASYVGPIRAGGIIQKVAITLDEFLS